MPPERTRLNNPQGRQKSCSECAKAKRRCDLRQPTCLRCTQQSLTCSYPAPPRQSNGCPISRAETWHGDIRIAETTNTPNMYNFDPPDILDKLPNLTNEEGNDLLDLEIDFEAADQAVNSLNDLWNDGVDESFPVVIHPAYTSSKHFSLSHLSSYARSRFEYSIEQLKTVPASIVSQNSTPWSHPCLYEEGMPRSMQDACAACALYLARNNINQLLVARYITERAHELSTSPPLGVQLEVLARAQALLLYQIIILFSSDVYYYSQADNLIPHLEDSTRALSSICQDFIDPPPDKQLPLFPSVAAQSAWKSFVFQESCQRTVLSLCHFIALCNLVHGRVSTCQAHLTKGRRVTFSAHLWNANSGIDFALAWNGKKHFLVKELDTAELLETAKADDIDVFGKVMLTGMMGIEDVRGWFHTRGGVL